MTEINVIRVEFRKRNPAKLKKMLNGVRWYYPPYYVSTNAYNARTWEAIHVHENDIEEALRRFGDNPTWSARRSWATIVRDLASVQFNER